DGISLGVTPQVLPGFLGNIILSGPPISVAALSSGTKAYAALGGCPAGTNHISLPGVLPSCTGNKLSVIDTVGLREIRTITVGPGAVSVDVASDGSRVYAVSALDTTTITDNVHGPGCTGTGCLPGPVLAPRTFAAPSIFVIPT